MSTCGSLWRVCPCAHMHVAVIGLMDQDGGRYLTENLLVWSFHVNATENMNISDPF